VRILDHAVQKLGIRGRRMIVNVDRYGNTSSSAAIPLALAEAQADGRLKEGETSVLMTAWEQGSPGASALMDVDPVKTGLVCVLLPRPGIARGRHGPR